MILLANNEVGMKEMLRRFKRYIERKGLELNVKKYKMIEFRKGGGRRKNVEFTWGGDKIEIVREINYLGYKLHENNGKQKHIRYVTATAREIMGKIWGIGERVCREEWKKRMRIFDALVESIMMYGVEIWGWRGWEEVEKIQDTYIKWVMKLDKTTSRHILHEETGRYKIEVKAEKCAVKYERRLENAKEDSLKEEFWRIIKKEKVNTEREKRRKEFMEKRGWPLREVNRRIEEGEEI